MEKNLITFLFSISLLTLSACQTNQLKAYGKVEKGMDKHQVVEIMGSPTASTRWQGKDRWKYRFYEDDQLYIKEVQFDGGKVVYVGDEVKSTISAEDQDSKNEAENKDLEAQALAKKEAAKKALPKWEEEIKGDKKVKYVPEFEPIK